MRANPTSDIKANLAGRLAGPACALDLFRLGTYKPAHSMLLDYVKPISN